jgi:hypothetical protein
VDDPENLPDSFIQRLRHVKRFPSCARSLALTYCSRLVLETEVMSRGGRGWHPRGRLTWTKSLQS